MIKWEQLTAGKRNEFPEVLAIRIHDFDLRVYGPCNKRSGWCWKIKHAPFDGKVKDKYQDKWSLYGPEAVEKSTLSEYEAKVAALTTLKAYLISAAMSCEKAKYQVPDLIPNRLLKE